MVNKNIQMKERDGNQWNNLFPITLIDNIFDNEGNDFATIQNEIQLRLENKVNEVKDYTDQMNQLVDVELYQMNQRVQGKEKGMTVNSGGLSITLDNNYITTYTNAYPVFKARQLPFAISPVVDGFTSTQRNNNFYSLTELNEMMDYGAEIVAHGVAGTPLNVQGIDLPYAEYEIKNSKLFWNKLGYDVKSYCGSSSTVYPDYMPYVKENYDFGFTEYWARNEISEAVTDDTTDIYNMGRLSLSVLYKDGGLDRIKEVIDYVHENNKVVHFYNHYIGGSTGDAVPINVLEELLDYAVSLGVDVLTPTEAVQKINSKFISKQNISEIDAQIKDLNIETADNLITNPQFRGTSFPPARWTDRGILGTGYVDHGDTYNTVRIFQSGGTSNVGEFFGIGKVDKLDNRKKSDVLTVSVEIESNTSHADVRLSMNVSNDGEKVTERMIYIPLTEGKKTYEMTLPVPKKAYNQSEFNIQIHPTSISTNYNILFTQPKLEWSGQRTAWNDHDIETVRDHFEAYGGDVVIEIPSGESVPLKWENITKNYLQGYDTNTNLYTVQTNGVYLINAFTRFGNVGNRHLLQVFKNGEAIAVDDKRPLPDNHHTLNVTIAVALVRGDKISINAMIGGSSTYSLTVADTYSHFSITRMV